MNWKNKYIDLGIIRVGEKQIVTFESKTELDITTITSSCKCSTPIYDKKEKKLIVKYTPSNIPYHLMHEGQYETTKTITVYYKDGNKEILNFKATVKK